MLRRGIRCHRWHLHPLFLPPPLHLVLRCHIQEAGEGGQETRTRTQRAQRDGERECTDRARGHSKVKPGCHEPCKWVRVTDGEHGERADKEVEEGLSANGIIERVERSLCFRVVIPGRKFEDFTLTFFIFSEQVKTK